MYSFFVSPFIEFEFMRRALVRALALAVAGAPIGVFLVLRRMALSGDAMQHAILPGAAVGYLAGGLSLGPMTAGGVIAGLFVAIGSGVVARTTNLREDASMGAFYLISLALGVTIISLRGSNIDLLHVLFGSVLAFDDATLLLLASISSLTLIGFALIYRPLVMESVDPGFLASVGSAGGPTQILFLTLVVLNLVAGFQALGTLLAVGMMMLPAAGAYLAKLADLDKEVRAALAKIPPERREIITTNDAFGYFGETYGFKFIAPEGVSTETEASAKDVAKIIRQIKAEKIPAVFLENVTDPRIAKRIAEESGATIGGALYSDALSPPDGPGSTYIDMMHNNIRQLSAALSS